MPNDGFLGRRDGGWTSHGDAVDVALLVMAHKAGFIKAEVLDEHPELASIPFESERLFAASLNTYGNTQHMYVKGAWDKIDIYMDNKGINPLRDLRTLAGPTPAIR